MTGALRSWQTWLWLFNAHSLRAFTAAKDCTETASQAKNAKEVGQALVCKYQFDVAARKLPSTLQSCIPACR